MSNLGVETAWVTMATARRLLGVSRQRVYQLISEGKIVGVYRDKRWLINRVSVEGRAGQLELGDGR